MKFIILLFVIGVINMTGAMAEELSGKIIADRLQSKANILNDYISLLAQKDKNIEVKKYYMEQALNMFVNKGEPFQIDSVKYEGAYILIKSAYRNKTIKRKIKDYLQGVMDLRYSPIDVTAMKLPDLPAKIDSKDFVKCGNNLYSLTIMITRELAGYIDGTPVYKDITPYEYTIFINKEETIGDTEHTIYLPNIEAEEKQENKI